MKVAGIITEYNPFHNGHRYHIEETRRVTGADYVIAVMSGDFVQRGTPAVTDKYSRTMMALSNGVDIVIELPVCYATGSAEHFALGAVSLLNNLGIVDYLCFGSECGDIALLEEAAALLNNKPAALEEKLLEYIKEGNTYPAARARAVENYLGAEANPAISESIPKLMSEPNNILGLEYVKAIYKLSSKITPITIERQSANYHESRLTENKSEITQLYQLFPSQAEGAPDALNDNGNSVISSATAIRKTLQNSENIFGLYPVRYSVPDDVYEFLDKNYCKLYPITEEDFASVIKYKLLSESRNTLMDYVDITSDLADRIANLRDTDVNIGELVGKIKTKNLTLTRINRALIHLLLNIKVDAFNKYKDNDYTFYARVLGIKREASHLLRSINNNGRIPVVTKVSAAAGKLDPLGIAMLSEDIFAAHVYNQAVFEKYNTVIPNEYKHGICML